jgi:hypothetical protein
LVFLEGQWRLVLVETSLEPGKDNTSQSKSSKYPNSITPQTELEAQWRLVETSLEPNNYNTSHLNSIAPLFSNLFTLGIVLKERRSTLLVNKNNNKKKALSSLINFLQSVFAGKFSHHFSNWSKRKMLRSTKFVRSPRFLEMVVRRASSGALKVSF